MQRHWDCTLRAANCAALDGKAMRYCSESDAAGALPGESCGANTDETDQ